MADKRLQQLPTVEDAHRVTVVDVEVAPYVPGALVAYNADTSFERLGTIEPGSAKLEGNREFFKLERGLPKSLIKKFVIGQDAKLPIELGEYTMRAVEVANGGTAMARTTTSATTVKTATTPTTTTMNLTTATGYAKGKWVSITIAALGRTFDRKIKAIAGDLITIDELPQAPAVGDAVAVVTDFQLALGGTEVMEFTMRLVFVDQNGDKGIIYCPRVSSTGKFAPVFNPDKNAVIPIEFDVHATQMTWNGKTDFFPAVHYLIPA